MARSLLGELPGLDNGALRECLARLEAGDDYRAHGIHNFLEGDFFSWYLDVWDDSISDCFYRCCATACCFCESGDGDFGSYRYPNGFDSEALADYFTANEGTKLPSRLQVKLLNSD